MKQNKMDKQSSGNSALLYDTKFRFSYLMPVYWGSWLLIVFLFLVFLLPASVQDRLANLLGDLGRNINKKRRRIARKNIELCFPEISEDEKKELIRKNFRHQARSVLHYALIWWAPNSLLNKRIKLVGEENIQQSLNNNRSVIVMAAHSLGLEAAVSATSMRYPVSGPFKPMKNKLIDWFVAKGRARHGTLIYTRQSGLRPIIKDVRAGCTMFYLPDEDLGKDRSIFVPFFGVMKATVPVLGRLSKSCRADVIPCVACYDESLHQYVIHYLPAISGFPNGEDEVDSQVMNHHLESLVKLCPAQYFWTMKLFKTRPEGEDRFY